MAAAQASAPNPVQQAADTLNNQAHALYLKRNYTDAIKLYTASAQMGSAVAEYNLGLMNLYGQGVPKDTAQARSWLQKAAGHGSSDAKTAMAILDAQAAPAKPNAPTSMPAAKTTAATSSKTPATAKEKEIDALYQQAKDLMNRKQYAESFKLFSTLEQMGRPEGQNGVGLCYLYGMSVTDGMVSEGCRTGIPSSERQSWRYVPPRKWCAQGLRASNGPVSEGSGERLSYGG